jgi:hypothetical protein
MQEADEATMANDHTELLTDQMLVELKREMEDLVRGMSMEQLYELLDYSPEDGLSEVAIAKTFAKEELAKRKLQ